MSKEAVLLDIIDELLTQLMGEQDSGGMELQDFKQNWIWAYCGYDYAEAHKLYTRLTR